MGAYILDKFIDRERIAALATINKAYRPTVRLHHLTEALAFETIEETVQFIIKREGQELIDDDGDFARLKTGSRIWEDQKSKDTVVIDTQGLKGL